MSRFYCLNAILTQFDYVISGEHANEQIGTKNKVSGDEISQVIASFGPVCDFHVLIYKTK